MSKADFGKILCRGGKPSRREEMPAEEYRAAVADLIYLASCAVKEETPDKARTAGMDLKRLYLAAERHLLMGVAACALERAGICDPAFTQGWTKAIRKEALFATERAAVLAELDRAGIWYAPLKGTVIKEYYPEFGLRQMADNDILFDRTRSADVRAIMEGLGFETVVYQDTMYSHDHYFKEPICNFEMHRALFKPSEGPSFDYYLDIKDRLLKDPDNACGFHFRSEDFYLYMIAHEYRHYSTSGTGLRSLLDTYVFLRRFDGELDQDYIKGELEKLRLTDFEGQNRSLSLHLFGGEPLTEAEREMLDFILASGAYGMMENRVKNAVRRYGAGRRGKLRYALRRLVLTPEEVKVVFPLFWKVPILLPLLPLYRCCRSLVINRAALKSEFQSFRKLK